MPLLTETFESYGVRGISNAALGPWACYQIGVESGTGRGGSIAPVSYQGALQHATVNLPLGTRTGSTVVWCYRFSLAELAARGRDPIFYHGVNIQPVPTSGGAGSQSGFGVLNDARGTQFGPGHEHAMVFWTNWCASDGSSATYHTWSPPCVLDSVWQEYEFLWKLSTTAASSPYLNPDGCVQLYVDGVLVLEAAGLYLTLADNLDASVVNQWDGVYYAFGGLLDDLTVVNNQDPCPEEPEPPLVYACPVSLGFL